MGWRTSTRYIVHFLLPKVPLSSPVKSKFQKDIRSTFLYYNLPNLFYQYGSLLPRWRCFGILYKSSSVDNEKSKEPESYKAS